MKFSRMAAGMISTRVIQLQLLRNQLSLSARLRASISTIDNRPQGNSKKVEGLTEGVGIVAFLEQEDKK